VIGLGLTLFSNLVVLPALLTRGSEKVEEGDEAASGAAD
jgi:hypothetical protein